MSNSILCIGEILWDSLPLGLFLGGAPFNVAYHLRKFKEDVTFISRVGNDELGKEAIKRLKKIGIATQSIQIDQSLNTGFVSVEMDEHGVPTYDIKKPVAWDNIQLTNDVKNSIKLSKAIIFGTLSQRSKTSRDTIKWIKKSSGLKVLDLNFRFPDVDEFVVKTSLETANVLKMNEDELKIIISWFGLSSNIYQAVEKLSSIFSLELVCVTCGGKGALVYNKGKWYEHDGYCADAVDTVGAGDSFLAVMTLGYLKGIPIKTLLDYSNKMGAFVSTFLGGTPNYFIESLSDIKTMPVKISEGKEIKT